MRAVIDAARQLGQRPDRGGGRLYGPQYLLQHGLAIALREGLEGLVGESKPVINAI